MQTCTPLLTDIVALHGRWLAAKPALVADGQITSWAGLLAETNRVANGLIAAGCDKGARIGIVMDNSPAMLTAILGTMRAGAIAVPLNTMIADDAIDALLEDAGISAILASHSHLGRIPERIRRQCRLALAETDGDLPAGWSALDPWREGQDSHEPAVRPAKDDICNIIYSSGTTGQPKGIAHTLGARTDWAHDLAHALRYDSSARTLIANGLYSNISWVSMLCTLLVGGTIVLMRKFEPAAVLEVIEREQTSHTSMVPVQYQRLLEHPDFATRNTGSMRAMMCCGSPLPERVKAALFRHFPSGLIELYGTTEGAVTTLAPEDAQGRIASVGKPLPGADLLILGDADRPTPEGEPGEIVMRTRFVMREYWQKPDITGLAFWTDPQGRSWLRTGDIGRLDEEGFLYITDRKKDVIISGGQNIYPADLEAVLMRHEAVSDCAVVSIPSERWGEAPLGLVVFMPGAELSEAELLDWANARLGKQQRLYAIERRDELERNANGKLLKRELRAPYWDQKHRKAAV